MSREKEVEGAVDYVRKTDEYRQIIRTAITNATRADNTEVCIREYDFTTFGSSEYKYESTSNYVDKHLVENDLVEALIEIDKLREVEISIMEAKIEAYELALTGMKKEKEDE